MGVLASSRRRGNLPVELTSFVGRRRELAEVRRSLSEFRLVTLIGVGGVGKTRLALRAAGELRRAFRDGVWLVDVAGLTDEALLTPAVVQALGLRDSQTPQRCSSPRVRRNDTAAAWQVGQLAKHLADMQVLLVLDNCEHLVVGCAVLLDALLRSCPQLRVLATSRQALGIDGERTIRVPPLSRPPPDRPTPTAKALLRFDSVSLLVQRAAAVLPGFSVNVDNHVAVARLCQCLDGIPLAIELAAVRLRALSVDQVLDRLADRYGLLRTDSPATTPRQQTLRALIDWSFDMLTAQERLLWARLSVFAGSFELDAVEQVCADDALPTDSIAERMAGLVDKSVVIRENHDARARCRLLETIRQYGRDRLREADEEAELQRRHRDWYRHLVTRAEAERYGPDQLAWYQQLRAEHSNLRAVLNYCLTEPGAVGEGQRIAAAMQSYWVFGGALSEGRRWLERLLAADETPSLDRARALAAAGRLAVRQNQVADAVALLAEGRAIARQFADEILLAQMTFTEGLAELSRGEPPRAVELFEQSLAVYRAERDRFGTALALTQLGTAWTLLGDTGRAEAFCQEALALSQARGERWCAAHALWTLGLVAWRQGDLRRAEELGKNSARLRRPFQDWGVAVSLELLAWVASAQGHDGRAARLLGALQTTWRSIGTYLPAPWTGEHERCKTRTRVSLGQRNFDAAFRDGQALTLDEAVSYALEQEPDQGPARADHEAGVARLTRRETEIAELVAEGLSNKEIAAKLVIAQRTAEGHVEHILAKLGSTSRAQIATWIAGNRDRSDR